MTSEEFVDRLDDLVGGGVKMTAESDADERCEWVVCFSGPNDTTWVARKFKQEETVYVQFTKGVAWREPDDALVLTAAVFAAMGEVQP